MQHTPMSLLSVALLCLLACRSAASASAVAANSSDSIWRFVSSRPELSTVTYIITQFPDVLLRLSDPELASTMFLPTNNALQQCRYSDTSPACFAPLRQLLKSFMDTYDILAPGMDVGRSASSNRRYTWQFLMSMALETPKALTLKALKNGSTYATAACAVAGGPGGIDPSNLYVYKNATGTFLSTGEEMVVARVRGDYRAGKSVVHLVDANVFPGIPPLDSYYSVYEGVSGELSSFTAVLMAVKDTLNLDMYALPLTVFAPSNTAMQRWLRSSNSSLDLLLNDTALCLELAQAHCAPSKPLTWAALLTPDMIAIAAAQAEKMTKPPIGIRNLRGQVMQLKTQYSGVSPGPLYVSFAEPGSASNASSSAWGVVLPPVDFGGQEVSFGEEGGVVHTVHKVDRVLMV